MQKKLYRLHRTCGRSPEMLGKMLSFERILREQTWPAYYPFKILNWFNNQYDLKSHTETNKCKHKFMSRLPLQVVCEFCQKIKYIKVVWQYGETDLKFWTWKLLTKSVDFENEVKVRWHMSSWHIPTIIKVWTKYGQSRLHGNMETDPILKTWHKMNQVIRPWKWGQDQVTHAQLI